MFTTQSIGLLDTVVDQCCLSVMTATGVTAGLHWQGGFFKRIPDATIDVASRAAFILARQHARTGL
jgi:hypothetical protein